MESIDLKKRPDKQQFEELFERLDPDRDGRVEVADLHKLVKALEMRPETRDEEDEGGWQEETVKEAVAGEPPPCEAKAKKEAGKRARKEAQREARKGGAAS